MNNTETPKLADWLIDGDIIKDSDELRVYDTLGALITRGAWFEDRLLALASFHCTVERTDENVVTVRLN